MINDCTDYVKKGVIYMKSVGNKKMRNRIIIGSAVGVSLAFVGWKVVDVINTPNETNTTEVIVVETSEEMMSTDVLSQTLASSETTDVEVTEAITEEIEDEMSTEVESTERTDEEDEDDTENVGNTGNTGNSSNGSTGNTGNGGSSNGNGSGSNGNSGNSGNGSTGNAGNGGNTGNTGNSGNAGNGSTENMGNGGSSTTTTESTTTETTETTESDEPSYGDLVWVVDQEACWVEVPVYETVYKEVCNGCGADITGGGNPTYH